MKKLFLMGFAALVFASCVSDKEVTPLTQDEKYQQAFENLVGGKINANVNWGFNNLSVATFDQDGKFVGMRGANPEGNLWAGFIEVPTALTEAQKAVVRDWFQANPNYKGVTIVNWSEFFVEQVYKGGTSPTAECPEKYIAGNGGEVVGSDHMDKLTIGFANDHIFDFNNSNNNDWNGFMLMQNSTTNECFGYFNSVSSEQKNDKYILVPGDIIDPSVAGMYFVGFDFEATGANPNQQVAADGYYSDWIVRIVPGLYKNAQRIMVEDLIAQNLDQVNLSDWDFNDAVFDVAFVKSQVAEDGFKNHLFGIITLWAAGGTQALTVAGKEVHELFGQPISTMINTNANGGVDGLAPVIFRADLGVTDWDDNIYATANDIKVMVGSIELKAEKGKAPQKIAVPTTTKWMKERQIITKGYTKFGTYAIDAQPEDWYNEVSDASALY